MGFAGLFSTTSKTDQFIQNKQIGQSGAGSTAISGDVSAARDFVVMSNDPEIALAAINASSVNQIKALETLQSVGERFAGVAEYGVKGAQETALNALPLTPEQITASRGGFNSKDLLPVVVVVGLTVAAIILVKKYKH